MNKQKLARELVRLAKELTGHERKAARGSAARLDRMAQAFDKVFEDSKSVLYGEGNTLTRFDSQVLVEMQKRTREWAKFARVLKRKLG